MLEKLLLEIRNARENVAELRLEKPSHRRAVRQRVETLLTLEAQEERAGVAAILIRKRDQHERMPGPDMERIELEPLTPARGDDELLVAGIEQDLARLAALPRGHRASQGRSRTISAKN